MLLWEYRAVVGAGLHEPGSTMSSVLRMSRRILGLVLIAVCASGDAQVPPHPPGTVCYTPQFWCWMMQPGYPGTPCYCPSPYGLVRGVVG